MSFFVSADDPRLGWPGAVSLEHTPEWTQPWRLPYREQTLFPPVELLERAAMPAGVRLTFHSDSRRVAGRIAAQTEIGLLDLFCDGRFYGSVELENQSRFSFDGLPPHEKLLELWLPQFGVFRLAGLELENGATLRPYASTRPRWITYGSSITQCRAARSPGRTWPALVARHFDLDLTCLGFGGQCYLEPMLACLIRDRPAEFISVCAGINIYILNSLNSRTFGPAILGFIRIIREKRPATPLLLISPIISPEFETTPNQVGFILQAVRREV